MSLFNRQRHENVIIVGCGCIGAKLASILDAQNDRVSIIDLEAQSFSKLSHSSNYCLVEGDAMDIDILECAGIKTADIIIVTTNDDNTNIAVAKIAKEYYKVQQVIACIGDTSKEFAYKQMDIIVISPLILLMDKIQQVLTKERGV